MTAQQLPPVPDAVTGVPRPPAAPLTERLGRKRDDPTPHDRKPRKAPDPPAGMGPMLEWSQLTWRDAWKGALIYWLILSALLTFDAKGFGWIRDDAVIWVPMFALSWLFNWGVARQNWLAAGSMWVQRSRGGAWVNTYALTRIRFGADGYKRVLRVRDAEGREIKSLGLYDLQTNAAMWNLVYNGILHSVASGNCEIDAKARRILKLPAELGG